MTGADQPRYMPIEQARTLLELYGGPCLCEPTMLNSDYRWHWSRCSGPCATQTTFDELGHVTSGYGMCVPEGSPGWEESDLSWKLPEARLAIERDRSEP